eukprot:CAMPEP_0205801164 /NCGR_PEP_ID=MMETSP0205-20121125/3061_1 /ASSEMBLY_ACC=CAM_ASM_000278 /TAXON_ID=36767 /ORGANISM="Euplotes focardii, Strain TN1" /LENGTH=46 /DNA_ID= /DNA_START= /DNA_END= /DNA_ORIENTATION=
MMDLSAIVAGLDMVLENELDDAPSANLLNLKKTNTEQSGKSDLPKI